MKHFLTILFIMIGFGFCTAQVDELDITTTDDIDMKLSEYLEEGKNNLLLFWASWCSVCRNEKNTLVNYYDSWTEDYNTEVISISTDQVSARPNAVALFASNNWPYDLVFTTSQEARDNFDASGVPYTFLINSDNEIIWSKQSFRSGDEITIDEKVKEAFETSDVSELEKSALAFIANYTNNGILITFDNVLVEDLTINAYDIEGRILDSKNSTKGSQVIEFNGLKSGYGGQFIIIEAKNNSGTGLSKLVAKK